MIRRLVQHCDSAPLADTISGTKSDLGWTWPSSCPWGPLVYIYLSGVYHIYQPQQGSGHHHTQWNISFSCLCPTSCCVEHPAVVREQRVRMEICKKFNKLIKEPAYLQESFQKCRCSAFPRVLWWAGYFPPPLEWMGMVARSPLHRERPEGNWWHWNMARHW